MTRSLVWVGALVLLSTLSACTWVELKEEAESIAVLNEAPSGCERLGASNAVTKADIGFIDRNNETVAEELQTLARNAAVRMGGDTVVVESEISQAGEQTFGIYRCD